MPVVQHSLQWQTVQDHINNSPFNFDVCLLGLKCGGVGLNLQGANVMIVLDSHWNPQNELQARKRIHRIGQPRTCYNYRFMYLDTVEERVDELHMDKLRMVHHIFRHNF